MMRNYRSYLLVNSCVALILLFCTRCKPDENQGPDDHPVRIVTWNVKDLLSLDSIPLRANDFQEFAEDINPDIILIQEIVSRDIVIAIRDEMELSDYFVACSNFVPGDGDHRGAFEVAIISKYPLSELTEYDPFPEGGDDPDMNEVDIVPLTQYGIVDVGTSRGFLMAKVSDLDLYIGVTHLKSSLGSVGIADSANAAKRELVAAFMAKTVNDITALDPGVRVVVGGDFNVGHSDNLKNGTNLLEDCYDPNDCPGEDLYDETHALLGGGLIDGLQMANKALSITETTYPDYPGSPIDNLYALWKGQGECRQAVRVNDLYGSDHVPVYMDLIAGD